MLQRVATSEGGTPQPTSRTKNWFPSAALVKQLKTDSAVIDGEVFAWGEDGRPVSLDLLRGSQRLCFAAFDLPCLDGPDLRPLPRVERKKILRRLLPKRWALVVEAPSVEAAGKRLFEVVRENDLEGILAKRRDAPYSSSARWWKIKNPAYSQRQDGRAELLQPGRDYTRSMPLASRPIQSD
jgi:ATP-dependent DNA ligase